MSVHVVKGSGPNLVGRNLLPHLEFNSLSLVESQSALVQSLLNQYSAVFDKGLGCLKGWHLC